MSWFKRKPKNRRTGHEHVLDVKLRSDHVRKARMRLAAVALGLVFATVLGFYTVWQAGDWVLNRLIYENQAFAVQEIDIQTDGIIALSQLHRWAGVRIGENLLALDLSRVKRDLEMVSIIRFVAVERILPHTLRVRVQEREPLARVRVPQWSANGSMEMPHLHLDEEGYVMTLLPPGQRAVPATQTNDVLPFIDGINLSELVPGKRVDSAQARAALQFIAAFEESPMSSLVDLRQIDVSSPDILQETTGSGSEVTVSIQDLDRQLRRWQEIHTQGQRLGKKIVTLDLSVRDHIPARFADGAGAAPAMLKTKNPQRNRRKYV